MTNERIEQVRLALVNKVVPLSKKAEYARIFECGVAWADENPVNPWISVEERLPEKINKFMSEPVLCRYTRGGKEYYHVTQYDFDYNQWMIGNVTHWMPIPSLKRDEEDIDDPRLTEKQKKELGYK